MAMYTCQFNKCYEWSRKFQNGVTSSVTDCSQPSQTHRIVTPEWLDMRPREFFNTGIQALYRRWMTYIERCGAFSRGSRIFFLVHFKEVQEYSIPGHLDSLSSSDSDNTKYDINANTPDGLQQRPYSQSQYNKGTNLNNSALDKKQSAVQGHSKSMPHANTFVGRFLKVSPGDELTFQTRDNGDSFDVITLTNTLPYSVAFKVKTTSPEKFRVRPSSGLIKPDKKEEVYIYLVPDQAGDVSKEKFLVMAMESHSEGVDANHLFRDAARDKVMQHKLKCSVGFQESLQTREVSAPHVVRTVADPLSSKDSRSSNAGDFLPRSEAQATSAIDKQIEQLQLQNRHMQRQLNLLLGIQSLTMLTLLLIILLYSCFGEDLFSHFLALPFESCHQYCGRKC